MADSSADSSTDHPVGMAYLLGNWATDHRAISCMFDVSLLTDGPATAITQPRVTWQQGFPVGMALKKQYIGHLETAKLIW